MSLPNEGLGRGLGVPMAQDQLFATFHTFVAR